MWPLRNMPTAEEAPGVVSDANRLISGKGSSEQTAGGIFHPTSTSGHSCSVWAESADRARAAPASDQRRFRQPPGGARGEEALSCWAEFHAGPGWLAASCLLALGVLSLLGERGSVRSWPGLGSWTGPVGETPFSACPSDSLHLPWTSCGEEATGECPPATVCLPGFVFFKDSCPL